MGKITPIAESSSISDILIKVSVLNTVSIPKEIAPIKSSGEFKSDVIKYAKTIPSNTE